MRSYSDRVWTAGVSRAGRWIWLALGALICALGAHGADRPASAQGPAYTYFPSAATNDARMLSLSGNALQTLGATKINIALALPPSQASFELGIFDGDTGRDSAGALNDVGGHWDSGTDQLIFTLYADPLEDQSGRTVIAQWTGNTLNALSGPNWTASGSGMPDNDWWTANISTSAAAQAPNGNFFYNLQITLSNPAGASTSNFKLRTTANLEVRASTFSFEGAARQQINDGVIIYPGWAGNTTGIPANFFLTNPTTYNGNWTFYMEVPASVAELSVWDGDFDFGNRTAAASPSGVALTATADTADPDTTALLGPEGIPDWATGTAAVPEGAKGVGNPADDSRYDFYRRAPAVAYRVVDPNGKAYVNSNPSGNNEWEQFKISTLSTAVDQFHADYSPTYSSDGTTYAPATPLPAGLWQIQMVGLDLANLDFLKVEQTILGVCADGMPCPTRVPLRPFTLGSTVWSDTDGNGLQGAGEAGIAGVTMGLYDGNNTLIANATTDTGGHYSFQVFSGVYTVAPLPANYLPGGLLAGRSNTAGGTFQTVTIVSQNELGLNFGYGAGAATAQIGDRVWRDLNSNGIQDFGEPGIANVGLTLKDSNGATLASTTTDAAGLYAFGTLSAGTYTVVLNSSNLPGAATSTYDLDGTGTPHQAVATVTTGQIRTDVDFGYVFTPPTGLGSIGSTVWLDSNANGAVNAAAGEAGLRGVRLTLLWDTNRDGVNDYLTTTTTSAAGSYLFSSLPAGNYTVQVDTSTLPSGVAPTYDLDGTGTANSTATSLNSGQNRNTVNFGYRGTASLGDTVWLDSNANGTQDGGEAGISGVQLALTGDFNEDGTTDFTAATTTSAGGAYSFAGLPPGRYGVAVLPASLPANSTQTYDLDGLGTANLATATLTAGQIRTDVDFGYVTPNATLSGTLFRDSNANGALDTGEPGLSGVTVTLRSGDGSLVGTTTTDPNGGYSFPTLAGGTYSVVVPSPASGYSTSSPSSSVTLPWGGSATRDFPYLGSTITGYLYNDANKNSARDGGEVAVTGATVTLRDGSGTQLATAGVDSNGFYTFGAGTLAAGSYSVSVPSSVGSYTLETTNPLGVTLAAGATSANNNFGYLTPAQMLATIAGVVWVDDNGNGVQDPGEVGLAGVTVLLRAPGGATPTVSTAADGSYSFTGLAGGNYSVEFPNTTNGVALSLGSSNVPVVLASGGSAIVNGPYHGATISGFLYTDTNRNQTKDGGEAPQAGVTVTMSGGRTATTDSSGFYSFVGNIQSGSYSVSAPTSANSQTLSTTNPIGVNVSAGQTVTNVNFGYQPLPATITGTVFLDPNDNGVQDSGEISLSTVNVFLTNSQGGQQSTNSDGSGHFSFTGLAAGTYTLSSPTNANGYTVSGGGTVSVTVAAGGTGTGNLRYHGGTLSGYLYTDSNQNQNRDGGETGLAGVTVILKDTKNAVVATAVTDSNGFYSFTNSLVTNTYVVIVPANVGVQGLETANNRQLTLPTAGTLTDVNFGYFPPNTSSTFATFTQDEYGAPAAAAAQVGKARAGKGAMQAPISAFNAAFPSGVTIGGNKTLNFTDRPAVTAFLPASGTPKALTASATRPKRSSAGTFAGEVLALKLNVGFSDAGVTRSGLGGLTVATGKLKGYTVYQVLTLANQVLGGQGKALPAKVSIADLSAICGRINQNFNKGIANKKYLQ